MRRKIVALTGAGISAESGLKTFRGNAGGDSDGLWDGHDIYKVATPEAWQADYELVLRFYNERRRAVAEAKPNPAHSSLARLQERFDLVVITQNIDDLHERAGTENVMHLHGQIFKSRSTLNENLVFDIEGTELNPGDLCPLGSQLRPHIVWFGEEVPLIESAAREVEAADVLLIIGTSLVVYPAAGLVRCVKPDCKIYVIDRVIPSTPVGQAKLIEKPASVGVPEVVSQLLQNG